MFDLLPALLLTVSAPLDGHQSVPLRAPNPPLSAALCFLKEKERDDNFILCFLLKTNPFSSVSEYLKAAYLLPLPPTQTYCSKHKRRRRRRRWIKELGYLRDPDCHTSFPDCLKSVDSTNSARRFPPRGRPVWIGDASGAESGPIVFTVQPLVQLENPFRNNSTVPYFPFSL